MERKKVGEQGSTFKAYGILAWKEDSINAAYVKLQRIEVAADHIMLGFQILRTDGKVH